MFFIFVYMCTCVAKMALFMMRKSSLFRIVFMSGISPLSEKDREREEKERIRKRERDRNTVGLTSGLLTHLTHTHTHFSTKTHMHTYTHIPSHSNQHGQTIINAQPISTLKIYTKGHLFALRDNSERQVQLQLSRQTR